MAIVGLEKKEATGFRQWGKRKYKTNTSHLEKDHRTTELTQVPQDTEVQDSQKSGWNNTSARKQLAMGINEVTKALEKNTLRLVLVCKSVKPPHMTSHLITLSRTRQVPACQVPRLSECVSKLLGLKCVMALGFKCCDVELDDMFADTVAAIVPKVPPLNVTWIPDTCPSEGAVKEDTGEVRGIKRKLEDESAETSEMETTELTSCALQPLQVKRIIPNPSKIRKSKKKK